MFIFVFKLVVSSYLGSIRTSRARRTNGTSQTLREGQTGNDEQPAPCNILNFITYSSKNNIK